MFLQLQSAEAIGENGGDAFLQDPLFQNRSVHVVFDLIEQLVLTAGNGQDHGSFPGDGLHQGEVRGNVTGVKCYHHVGPGGFVIIGNIPHFEVEPFVVQIAGYVIAEGDDVFFQIQPHDVHVHVLLFLQIIVQGEGQIGLSAAEVDDLQRGTFAGGSGRLAGCRSQMVHHVVHDF